MTQLNFNSVFVPWNYEKIMKKKKATGIHN